MNKLVAVAQQLPQDLHVIQRISKRNVPHLVVKTRGMSYSICYMARENRYRIFFPYPANDQERVNANDVEHVVGYFKSLKS